MTLIPEKLNAMHAGVYLVAMPSEHYAYVREALFSMLSARKYRSIYVSLNYPVSSLAHYLKRPGVDLSKFHFIDAFPEKSSKSLSSKSPLSIVKLSMDITRATDTGKYKFVIFDSLTTLLVYQDQITVERFMHYLINKLRLLNLDGAILVVDDEASGKILPTLSQFCDGVLSMD